MRLKASDEFCVGIKVMSNKKINIVDYLPCWPAMFEEEAKAIVEATGQLIIEIHHIGSTAVSGLAAKPVIDIMIVVTDITLLDNEITRDALAILGYSARGENGIAGRRYFTKGGDMRSHQLHAFAVGDPHIKRHLAFRDYLRSHKDICAEYASIKRAAAESCDHDAALYCALKDPFIQRHQARALEVYGC